MNPAHRIAAHDHDFEDDGYDVRCGNASRSLPYPLPILSVKKRDECNHKNKMFGSRITPKAVRQHRCAMYSPSRPDIRYRQTGATLFSISLSSEER